MNIKTGLWCALTVLSTQASLTWGGAMPETATQSPSNIPAEYQDAISKAYPGYQILSPSEILLDKEELGTKLYDKVKASPGLIVGKFNDDDIEDFAALIRNVTKKTYIRSPQGEVLDEFYDGHLVVCYGLGGGNFDCTSIPGIHDEIHLPFDFALDKIGPGKYSCDNLRKLDLSKVREPYDIAYGEKHNVKLTVHTDIIGYFMTGYAWAERKYIYQSKTFLRCVETE